MEEFFKGQDSIYHRTIEALIFGNRLHRAVLERSLNKSGVYRSQHQILMSIAGQPDLSQKDIAKIFHISTATVAVSLKKLEKGGYVKRLVDQNDNRCNQIRITEKGREVVENSHKLFQYIEEAMFSGFSQEEMNELEFLLRRMGDNLQKMLPDPSADCLGVLKDRGNGGNHETV